MKTALLFLVFAASVCAQAPPLVTTLSQPVALADSQINLTVATGVGVGSLVFVDREEMTVLSIAGTAAKVIRGGGLTRVTGHAAGVTAYVGTQAMITASDLSGSCSPSSATNYQINPTDGNIYLCTSGVWTLQNGGGGGGAISSVFGRTGAVAGMSGDYTTAQVTESGNLYFTAARAVSALAGLYQTPLTFTAPIANSAGTVAMPKASATLDGYLSHTDWVTFNAGSGALATASTPGAVIVGTGLDVTTGGVISTNVTTAGDLGAKCDGSTNDTVAFASASNVTVILPQNSICMVSGLTFGSNVILRGNATLRKIASDTANPLINQYGGSNVMLDGVTLDFNGVLWGSYPNNNTASGALTCSGGVGYPAYTTVAMSFSGGGGSNLGGLMYTSGTGTCSSVLLTVPGHGYTSNPTASAACPVGWSGCTAPTFSWGTTTPATAANTMTSSNSAQIVFQYIDGLKFNNVSVTNTGGSKTNGSLYANAFSFVASSFDSVNTTIDATVGGLDAYIDPYQYGAQRAFHITGGHLDGSQLGGIKVQTSSLIPKVKGEIAGVSIGCRAGSWTTSTTMSGALAASATTGTVANASLFQVGNPIIFGANGADTLETGGFRITAIAGNVLTWTPGVVNSHTTGLPVVYPFQVYGTFDATGNNGPYGNAIDTFLVGGVNIHDNRLCEPRFSGIRIAGVGSQDVIARANSIEYAGETGLYCAELGAAASICEHNYLYGTNISDTNPSSRIAAPNDLPNLIADNWLFDCGYACIHAEHATVTRNHLSDFALGIDIGNGGTGYNNFVADNVLTNTGLGAVNTGVGVAVSQGFTTTATQGNYLRGNAFTNAPYPLLTTASINSYGPNITGISSATTAVITFGSLPNPAINVGEVWMIRGQYMVAVAPNSAGKYVSINGSMCGVTATTTTVPYTATCGGVTGFAALNTTTYTPWQAPLAGNNPGLFTRVYTTSLVPAAWPSKVKMVRDNANGSDNAPTITAGAALGTGGTASAVTASSDTSAQVTLVLGSGPTTGTVATGAYSLPTSRFSSPSCQLVNAASNLSIASTQTTWTITATGTAPAAATVQVLCKLD